MEYKERNEQIRQKILGEIADIEAFAHERTSDELKADRMYQKAIVMSLINIGELSKSFTDDYTSTMRRFRGRPFAAFATLLLTNTKSSISMMSRKPSGKISRI